ncbi:MAG: ribonuclease H-like domain-containing protein [Lachnospiraceae bacterium]|nr:ribonuclease H-like domain-containing protein [Lachnospiraceae bacterium]
MLHEIQPLNREEIQLIDGKALRSILREKIQPQVQTPKIVSSASVSHGFEQTERTEAFSEELSCHSCLFFDIETTGLSADTSFVFLIGCIYQEDGKWNRHQFCIRLVQEERLLLSSFFEMAKKARFLIHFNGNTFDIPFIEKRAAANGLCPCFDGLLSIDLYQRFRPLRRILNLPHMNQSFLEKYIGWEREDKLSGKEVVSLFWNYASFQKTDSEKTHAPGTDHIPAAQTTGQLLLRHNRDDLLGMLHVLKMEAYHLLFCGEILPDISEKIADDSSNSASHLRIDFPLILPLPRPLTLKKMLSESEPSTAIILSADSSSGVLTIPLFHGTLRYYIPDHKNYYYLPLERQAIHKSVASYVAKEYRVPATPETCCIEKSGCFLPLPKISSASDFSAFLKDRPLFRENYEAKQVYFEYSEEIRQQKGLILTYTKTLLKDTLRGSSIE